MKLPTRTRTVLAEGAARALVYPLGYATVGLVLTLRRPTNPIGWLYAAAGLMWSLSIPGGPSTIASWSPGRRRGAAAKGRIRASGRGEGGQARGGGDRLGQGPLRSRTSRLGHQGPAHSQQPTETRSATVPST